MWFGEKALVLRATVADVIHYCQLPKELGFQGRVPTENQNLVPCARAVVEDVACIVVHIVVDRYRCTRVQISACGKRRQLVCALLQRCLSVFLNAHTCVDCKRRVRCDCSTNFAHTTEETLSRDWSINIESTARDACSARAGVVGTINPNNELIVLCRASVEELLGLVCRMSCAVCYPTQSRRSPPFALARKERPPAGPRKRASDNDRIRGDWNQRTLTIP